MSKPQTTEEVTPHVNAVAVQDAPEISNQQVMVPNRPKPPLVSGAGVSAIIPRDVDQVFRLSNIIASADMAPKSYSRDPNKIMVGIMHGAEVGLPPMAALQSIAVINGMPSIWGDGALALIEASGLLEDKKEWVDVDAEGGLVAHCHMKRKGRSMTEQSFSWKDAKIAKLTGKDTYQFYGRRMLQRRARAWAMTDGFADVLRGLHIREAIDNGALEQAASGNYEPVQTAEEAKPRPTREDAKATAERVRKVAVAQDTQYRDTMAEEKAKPQPEPAQESEPHDAETGEVNEPEPTRAAPAEPTSSAEHEATERVLRRKLESVKGTQMFQASMQDYKPELDAMQAGDPKRYAKLMQDVYAKHPKLKG